jgi:hypothetical protein
LCGACFCGHRNFLNRGACTGKSAGAIEAGLAMFASDS